MNEQLNKIIKDISKIENAAVNATEKIDKEKVDLIAAFREKKEGFKKEESLRLDSEIEAERVRLGKENEESINALKGQSEEKIKAAKENFEKNHENWAEEIARKVVEEL